MIKKKFLNVPLWIWFPIIFITFILYSIYCYSDIIWTTKNGLTVWYLLFDGKSIGEFYATPYPLDSNIQHAYYDFFIYIIFALWDLPLFLYEKITHMSFIQNYFTLLYAKSIILPFLVLCASQIYKMAYRVTEDKEKAGWSVFSYIFSVMVFQAIVIMGGYDVISLFFTLCGINAYLENRNKKFLLYFACAIACKMFALWIFIPLVLIRWKKIWKVLSCLIVGISFIVIPKMYFILYERISGMDTLIDGIDNTISSSMYIEYLWSSEAPLTISSMPLFFFFTFLLWVTCWFYKEKLSDRMIIFVSLLSMSIFILTCDTHPQWIILIVPYIAILECLDWNNLSVKLFLEVCSGISAILWQVRRRPQCYSYNIVNNMLRIEDGNEEFWFTGIWTFISKLSDVTQVQIDYIWTFFRSILVASFLLFLFYLFPRKKNEVNFPQEGKTYFYLKAGCCLLVLGIPLLGVIVRYMV